MIEALALLVLIVLHALAAVCFVWTLDKSDPHRNATTFCARCGRP